MTIKELKARYEAFSESLDLLNNAGQELPVVFNFSNGNVDIYFPFRARDVKAGFVDDLRREIDNYFEGCKVEDTQNRYVAYRVTGQDLKVNIDHLIDYTPITLRVAGFNRIVPYKLG